ncbi:transportin-3 [Aricia agestis]|uniref:transportin-3 n=1 Tax=Aricia agestis TaxID=91739 RepID=UPI001C207963|nr:transportin-3 [Aricia agestis]
MEAPSMETIYQAISALYDNPNREEKEKASVWLGDVQKSIHSWKVADELLRQKKDVQSCYFGAQTMRSKVQHSLSELPEESLISLRDTLVGHLENTSPDTTSAILTQLALAFADLVLQMISWQNCVSDMIKLFANKNDFALLEVLTVFPQEIDSSNLKLGENRREQIKMELRANSQIVTMFLKECLNNTNTHVALKVIKCMTSWIQVKAMSTQEVPNNAVIGFSLQVLKDYNSINLLHEAASDCVCSILNCLAADKCDDVQKLLFDSVSSLEESYHMAVAHEEEEKAANYARVFTEMAESLLEKIILSTMNGEKHYGLRSLELALVCVGHHDYEVAEITFNLWYRLSEEVYERDYQPLTDSFKPHIKRLIEALARHCQCEPDHANLPDDSDEFFDFRSKVMQLIKDVVFIVGSSSVFQQMFASLQGNMPWEQTEAALFIMRTVAKNIVPDEYEYVPKVIEAILSMPEDSHPAVRKTCIQLLGELCEWIEKHPECLEPCLQLLIRSLNDKNMAHSAATALQHICKSCREHAAAHVPTLLRAAALADDLQLPLHTGAALLRALASATGRLPHDQLALAMQEAVAQQLGGLRTLLASGAELRKGTRSDPVLYLDRLAALFRDVDVPPHTVDAAHPCMPAFEDVWPVVNQIMLKYVKDGRVIERACRCVRFSVRACGQWAAAALPALATALASLYAMQQHSCVLYLAAVLADALAGPATAPALAQLLRALLPPALTSLSQPQGVVNNPDTVDDLFRLCIRYLQRIPLEFLRSGALEAVMQCALLACSLDHQEANSSVMRFLNDLVCAARSSRTDQEVQRLVNETIDTYGEQLMHALLEAAVLHLHAYMLDDVAEVVVELVRLQRARGVDWLGSALRRLPRALPAATEQQCCHFHQLVLRTEAYKDVYRLLCDFAKLYR